MSDHSVGDRDDTINHAEDEVFLEVEEAAEVMADDPDEHMDSDDGDDIIQKPDEEEGLNGPPVNLQDDSVARFEGHKDSIFCIAQHPLYAQLVATGGGDDVGYIFDSTPSDPPVLPASYESAPMIAKERRSLSYLARLDGHTDSVNAVTFTLPRGEYVMTAGLDGRLRAYRDSSADRNGQTWMFVAEVQEVEEIGWLEACPHPQHPNTVALGANDGSVWVYKLENEVDGEPRLEIVQVFYLHTQSCTAGAWTRNGNLLATVSEDGSFYVVDVFAEVVPARASSSGEALVSMTKQDQRFTVDGGWYSIAIVPTGIYAVIGGAGGHIRVVSLPQVETESKKATSKTQAGQILASIQVQSDSIESLAFSHPPHSSPGPLLLAAGSVDGSIALLDTSHQFALRRHIQQAHSGLAVVKVDFTQKTPLSGISLLLTSAGMDGVIRRWDTRGASGSTTGAQGLAGEWKGHLGDSGGGILGFVEDPNGSRVVTAGDE